MGTTVAALRSSPARAACSGVMAAGSGLGGCWWGKSITAREVWKPVANREPGLPRLLALLDRWLAYHRRRALPGGCFVTTTTIEFDARPGPLRDAVARARRQMHAALEADIRTAVEAGDLPADTSPADVAFALYALASAASQAIQLEEPGAAARARHCMRALLAARLTRPPRYSG